MVTEFWGVRARADTGSLWMFWVERVLKKNTN